MQPVAGGVAALCEGDMVWLILGHLIASLADLVAGGRRARDEKDLEIALLRHQLRILRRKAGRSPRLARWEKLTLAVVLPLDMVDNSNSAWELGIPQFRGRGTPTG
jgi:hypothetical protein